MGFVFLFAFTVQGSFSALTKEFEIQSFQDSVISAIAEMNASKLCNFQKHVQFFQQNWDETRQRAFSQRPLRFPCVEHEYS